MIIRELKLANFRNYTSISLAFSPNLNVLIGANAQGKTNILEAIYLGAMGHSHRTGNDGELIRWEQPDGQVLIQFEHHGALHKLQFHLINSKNKEIIWNGRSIRNKELIGNLNVVLFSPEDLMLIKGSPQGRRRFLDAEISQASPVYYKQLMQYNRIVMQRNNLLKSIREKAARANMLDPWDEQLAVLAQVVVNKRLASVRKLTMLANLMNRRLTDNSENLTVSYELQGSSSPNLEQISSDWYHENLLAMRDNDIFRGSTSIGPHRDDLCFYVNNVNLKTYGSQGQQRTGVLALKLAELEFIRSETGEYPVLLLDDVMSELDKSRRQQLLVFVRDRIQTFITATDATSFSEAGRGTYYQVVNGSVTE